MMDPRPVKRGMLVGVLEARVADENLDFTTAKRFADHRAREALANPLLLAWFDRKAWKHSPAIC